MFESLTVPASFVLLSTVAGGVIGAALAALAWSNRETPAATSFGLLMVASAGWCLSDALLMTSSTLGSARLWGSLVGVCATAAPFLWLSFALAYTGRYDWLTRVTVPLIWAEPAAYTAFALTDPNHGFVSAGATVDSVAGLTVLSAPHSFLYYFHVAYVFVVLLAGFGLLAVFLLQADRLYRKQTLAVVVAGLLPFVGSGLYVAGVGARPNLDVTPVFFVAQGVVVAVALFRYDFLDVAPLAADLVLAEMDDPVVVLNDGRVAEHNPAADVLFDVDDPVGHHADEVAPGLLDAVEAGASYTMPESGVRPDGGLAAVEPGSTVVYDPRRTAVRDHHGIQRGELVVLREVTLQKRREETLRALQSATRRFMNAERREEIAEIVVDTADSVLDHPYSGVLFLDEEANALRSVALTDALAEETDGELVVREGDNLPWEAFESEYAVVSDTAGEFASFRDWNLPIGSLLLLPLGDHGVLGVGSGADRRTVAGDERRFARILASATETALDRAQREAEVRESRATVAERNEQIEFFNGVLRHDILNGMTVVGGNIELLEEHVDEDGKPHLRTIRQWSDDIAGLTRKVRSVIETVTDPQASALGPVSLSETLTERTEKVADTYVEANVEVNVEPGLRVRANDLLGEVVENLLLNAVEHAGPQPTISVRASEIGGRDGNEERIRVEIADDGPGIPDEMKSAVFDRNVTSPDSGSIGFGLYFVQVMVDHYGGAVRFEDADPKGAVAVLTLPTADAPHAEQFTSSEQ